MKKDPLPSPTPPAFFKKTMELVLWYRASSGKLRCEEEVTPSSHALVLSRIIL